MAEISRCLSKFSIDPVHVQDKSVNCPPTAATLEDKRPYKLVLASAKWCYSSIVVQPTKTYVHARYLNSQPTCNLGNSACELAFMYAHARQ